jgi:hypothetical protein
MTDRKRTEKLREGAYYGWKLRAVIDPPPRPSIIERLALWYERMPATVLWIMLALIAVSVGLAAVIVSVSR